MVSLGKTVRQKTSTRKASGSPRYRERLFDKSQASEKNIYFALVLSTRSDSLARYTESRFSRLPRTEFRFNFLPSFSVIQLNEKRGLDRSRNSVPMEARWNRSTRGISSFTKPYVRPKMLKPWWWESFSCLCLSRLFFRTKKEQKADPHDAWEKSTRQARESCEMELNNRKNTLGARSVCL